MGALGEGGAASRKGPSAVWVPAGCWALLPHFGEWVYSILPGPLTPPWAVLRPTPNPSPAGLRIPTAKAQRNLLFEVRESVDLFHIHSAPELLRSPPCR